MPIKLLVPALLALMADTPAISCEQHQTHAMQTTAEAAPVIPVPEATVLLPQSPVTDEQAISVAPEQPVATGGYGGCRNQTVYLTN